MIIHSYITDLRGLLDWFPNLLAVDVRSVPCDALTLTNVYTWPDEINILKNNCPVIILSKQCNAITFYVKNTSVTRLYQCGSNSVTSSHFISENTGVTHHISV